MNIIILCGLLLSLISSVFFVNKRNLAKRLKKLRATWGNIPDGSLDIKSAEIYFKLNKESAIEDNYQIDESTWHDLDLSKIFSLINRTVSPIGAQNLFYLLRHPVFKKKILQNRETLITHFSTNQDFREKVQLNIQSLKDKNTKYLPYSLWDSLPKKPAYAKIFPLIGFIALVALLLVIFQYLHFIVLIAIFSVNIVIHYLVKRKIDIYIYSFQYLGVLIRTAERLSLLNFIELKDIQKDLIKYLKETKDIAKKIFTLQFKDEFGFVEYLNIYFLWDISGFYFAIDKIEKHLDDLRNIYKTVGYLDALIAVASFRTEYRKFCCPSFNVDNNSFSVSNIYHPLLSKPVPNSFEFDCNNYLITGSNMAGKTTFLKTMGVNAILAQTINMSMADRFEVPLIKVVSSIDIEDDIISGKSYYLSEVESILRIIDASKSDIIHLFILDEIFRGTNSVERHAASIEVLNYLANKKDFILVATHDLQLSEALSNFYQNFHFQEKVSDKGLSFDYKLYKGIATTRNAITLLEYVGYPKSIIKKATNRIIKDENLM